MNQNVNIWNCRGGNSCHIKANIFGHLCAGTSFDFNNNKLKKRPSKMKLIFIAVLCLTITLGVSVTQSTKDTPQIPYHNCQVLLNPRIGNSNGQLKLVDSNGYFDRSCWSYTVKGTTSSCTLKAICWNNKKKEVVSTLLLPSDLAKACCY